VIENLWVQDHPELEEWKTAPLPRLVAHIVEHYHLEARLEMARMETLSEQAALLAGGENPELLEIRNEIARFCLEFRAHMTMEERSLFPYILDLDRGRTPGSPGTLMHPLKKLLEDEHLAETGMFRRLRGLASDAPCPGGLQARLQRALRAMERSLQGHIYLENQVLFRRVL
jgi:regulator of cell morphogenesis and NO signaling